MTELTKYELRDLQLWILDRIGEFCRDNGIVYHLGFGSLLGGIRYGGFIPWDDDIDLTMSRRDYTRFCDTFPAAHPDLGLGAPGSTDRWGYPFAKVFDLRTKVVENTDLESHIGVNVDIFPVDHCARTPSARRRHWATVNTLKALLTLKSVAPRKGRSGARAAVLRAAKPIVRRLPQELLVNQIDRAAAKYAGSSSLLSVLVGPYVWEIDERAMASSVDVDFEGRRVPAPTDHHAVLSAIYGTNYIEPPPENKRITHHDFKAYWA